MRKLVITLLCALLPFCSGALTRRNAPALVLRSVLDAPPSQHSLAMADRGTVTGGQIGSMYSPARDDHGDKIVYGVLAMLLGIACFAGGVSALKAYNRDVAASKALAGSDDPGLGKYMLGIIAIAAGCAFFFTGLYLTFHLPETETRNQWW